MILSESKDNEKKEVASDSILYTSIVDMKNDDVFRKVNFTQNENEKKNEVNQTEGKINDNDNNDEGIQNSKVNEKIKRKEIVLFSTNSKNENISSFSSTLKETKKLLEMNKKVNEKVYLAFEKQEFSELASEILQNTFQNLFSEVVCGEFLLQLPSLESSS